MKNLILTAALGTILAVSGCSSGSSMTSLASNPMISGLTSGLGLNPTQAIGGAGSLLGIAQKGLASADWTSLTKAIPDVDSLIGEAKKLGGISNFTTLAALTPSLGKLGLSSDQLNKMIPAISDNIAKSGGADLANKFTSAIK